MTDKGKGKKTLEIRKFLQKILDEFSSSLYAIAYFE